MLIQIIALGITTFHALAMADSFISGPGVGINVIPPADGRLMAMSVDQIETRCVGP